MYEAQDSSAFKLLEFDHQYLALSNSLDAYVFGYTFIHASINWDLCVCPTAFEMFLTSLAQNIGADIEILGSIRILSLESERSTHCFPNIGSLPRFICQSIEQLHFAINEYSLKIDGLISGIQALVNLTTVCMNISSLSCQQDFQLFRALQQLKNLTVVDFQFHYCKLTGEGEKELFSFFNSSKTLESVKVFFDDTKNKKVQSISRCSFNNSVIKNAMSCSVLRTFTTNVPFLVSKFPNSLKHFNFVITAGKLPSYSYSIADICACIFCVANLCKTSSLSSLMLTEKGKSLLGFKEFKSLFNNSYYFFAPPPKLYCTFLSNLNHALKSNSTIESLQLNFCNFKSFGNASLLSQALRKDPETNIRRSKSLSDLVVPFVPQLIHLPRRYIRKLKRFPKSKLFTVARSSSCPDLLELQTLSTLHPLIAKPLHNYDHKQLET